MNQTVRLHEPGILLHQVRTVADLRACSVLSTTTPLCVGDAPSAPGVAERELRRYAPLTRFALYAADRACAHAGAGNGDASLFLGLTHGTTSFVTEFYDQLFEHGPTLVGPNAFSNGVNNASLSAIGRHLKLHEGGTTILGCENGGLETLVWAAEAIGLGQTTVACVGAAEEYSSIVKTAYNGCGWFTGTVPEHLPAPAPAFSSNAVPLSEGALFFVMGAPSLKRDAASCGFVPVSPAEAQSCAPDIVISGAGGGLSDQAEMEFLSGLLSGFSAKPALLFPKATTGECFALSSIIGAAMAWDILKNRAVYPLFPVNPAIASRVRTDFPSSVARILLTACSRDGTVSLAMMEA